MMVPSPCHSAVSFTATRNLCSAVLSKSPRWRRPRAKSGRHIDTTGRLLGVVQKLRSRFPSSSPLHDCLPKPFPQPQPPNWKETLFATACSSAVGVHHPVRMEYRHASLILHEPKDARVAKQRPRGRHSKFFVSRLETGGDHPYLSHHHGFFLAFFVIAWHALRKLNFAHFCHAVPSHPVSTCPSPTNPADTPLDAPPFSKPRLTVRL